jgi:hypothetical protein
VVLASTGGPIGEDAVRAAADAARTVGGGAVAVVSVARLHGYALGLPNPGLIPTRKEKQAQVDVVEAAVHRLKSWAIPCDGQVVITRNPAKAIAGVARRRGAGAVMLQRPAGSRARRLVEGDTEASLRRRLGKGAEVRAFS